MFHCFTGNKTEAKNIIELGFYLGIGGVLTFKNSKLDEIMQEVSIENLLLETDSPYLAPVPKRGKRNESSYLVYVAQKLADIYKIPFNQVSEITTANARRLFEI